MRFRKKAIGILLLFIAVAGAAWWMFNKEPQGEPVPYTNPIYKHDAPDPTVLKAKDGYYYAITTQTDRSGSFTPLPILRSEDLVHWEEQGTVFTVENAPSWTTTNYFWAPHLNYHNGKYYVYYSTMINDEDESTGMGIGVAVADTPSGPYKDKGTPLLTGMSFDTIDPMVFDDDEGKRYIYWGSNGMPIYVQQLAEDGLSVVGEKKEALFAGQGTSRDGYDKLIEGPWVVKRGGYYHLFYSGDYCCQDSGHTAHYAVMTAKSKSPMGPFEANPVNPILEANKAFLAPGHNAVIQDDAGQDWMLYHAYDLNDVTISGRVMLIDRIEWKDGWPVVNEGRGPTADLQNDGPVVRRR